MPTKNPRLSVVLSPSLAATLAALSEETGDSASSLVRSLLEQTEPALQRMLELVKAAKSAKGQIGAGMAQAMDRVVDDLSDALAVADARTNRIQAQLDLVAQAQAVKGKRRPGGMAGGQPSGPVRAASTPRPVTRGVGTGKTRSQGVKGRKDGSL